MALISPFKKDLDKASREIDLLHRLYNVYFTGGEEDPPRAQRKLLETLIAKIKTQANTLSNAADKFAANSLVSKYQAHVVRWDKTLRLIENGTIPKPKKRE